MTTSNTSASGGIGTLGLLGVVFVTLKLCHVIDWSWWWVTAPFWGGVAFLLGCILAFGTALIFGIGLTAIWNWVKE